MSECTCETYGRCVACQPQREAELARHGVTPTGQAIHAAPHPQAGKAVHVDLDGGDLVTFYVEDWWDRVAGGSWRTAEGYPAAIKYALRIGRRVHLPFDDEVVYGKINGFGVLVHDSEIRAVANA